MKFLYALAALLASAAACAAEPIDCDTWFYLDKAPLVASLGKITAPGRTHFLFSREGCPSDATQCVDPAYVVQGDTVLLGARSGAWQCAGFPHFRGGAQGWLPVAAVQPIPFEGTPPLSAWTGKWVQDADTSVDISLEGPNLVVDGNMFWRNIDRDWKIAGKASPQGNKLLLGRPPGVQWGRAATLTLVGPYLIVQEKDRVNGLFVGFNGLYRRRQ